LDIDVQITEATIDDVRELAPMVREPDRQEIWAHVMREPEPAMLSALELSDMAWAARMNDDLICIFGVTPVSIINNVGTPWMISGIYLPKYSFAFLGHCKRYVAKMLKKYPLLINHVDARYGESRLWLRWLGFKMDKRPEPYGALMKPFFRFEMRS